ncbi:MAG: methionyl-tRNA formyltransferase [bacterium]|nr:methionyl-tRNA formyltransferase [bacterium]
MKIIFFGSFQYAVPALEALIKNGFEILAVVTNPDSLQGRKKELVASPVKIAAQEAGLKTFQPKTLKVKSGISPTLDPRLLAREFSSGYMPDLLRSLNPNLGIVVAYSKIIPKEILELFPKGVLNIHPSFLPAYRGPSPVQTAILNGETETGATIMQVDKEVDHGPILAQIKYQIPPGAYYQQVTQELFQLGAKLLVKTIPDWLAGNITPQPQDHSQATFTKKFSWQDGRIDWSQPAEKIYNQIRAFNPEPGTWTMLNGKILKILKASLSKGSTLDLQKGRPLILEEVQPEGKKAMPFQDFLHGVGKKELKFE